MKQIIILFLCMSSLFGCSGEVEFENDYGFIFYDENIPNINAISVSGTIINTPVSGRICAVCLMDPQCDDCKRFSSLWAEFSVIKKNECDVITVFRGSDENTALRFMEKYAPLSVKENCISDSGREYTKHLPNTVFREYTSQMKEDL